MSVCKVRRWIQRANSRCCVLLLFIYLFIHSFILYLCLIYLIRNQYSAVGVVPSQRTRRSGVRIPACERYFSLFQNAQTSSEAHPPSYSMGTGVLWDKTVGASTQLHVVLRLRMSRALLLFPIKSVFFIRHGWQKWTGSCHKILFRSQSICNRNTSIGVRVIWKWDSEPIKRF